MPNLPTRNNNPGDLRDVKTGGFRTFSDPKEGYAALLNDLHAKQTGTTSTGLGPASTLADFAKVYAPPEDNNNSAKYAADLANQIGVSPATPLSQLDLGKWADAVAKNEGYQGYNPKPFSQPSGGTQQPALQPTEPKNNGLLDLTPKKTFDPLEGVKGFLPGVGSDLNRRLAQGAGALTEAGQGFNEANAGKVGSGVLQTGGALAGALGDIVGRAAEIVPGVKQVEGLIGQGIGAGLKTNTGQALLRDYQTFSSEHPDAAKNIGAVANLASVIPMFKAIGLASKAASVGIGKTLSSSLEKGAEEEIIKRVGANKTAQTLIDKGAVQDLIQGDHLPAVETNSFGQTVYNSDESIRKINNEIQNLKTAQDTHLAPQDVPLTQSQLGQYIKVGDKTVIASPVNTALDELEKEYAATNNFAKEEYIKQLRQKLETTGLTVQEVNNLARLHGNDLNAFNMNGQLSSGLGKQAAENTRKGLKELVGQLDATGASRNIDGEISKLLNVKKLLLKLHNKPVVATKTGGLLKEVSQDVAGGVGEAVGNAVGLPFIGALGGRGLVGALKKRPLTQLERLGQSRTRAPLIRQALQQTAKQQGLRTIGQAQQ